jgi:AcrR family transcriptional regulator
MTDNGHSSASRAAGPFTFAGVTTPLFAFSRPPIARHSLPREFIEANQRNRLMAGAVDALAERGYQGTNVESIARAAGVSRNTFYLHYSDKQVCFLAAYDHAVEWLEGEVAIVAGTHREWAWRLRAAVAKALELLAVGNRLARLCTVEVFFAGVRAEVRHRDLVDRLSLLLGVGRGERGLGADLPLHLEPTLIGGAFALIARQLGGGEGPGLAELAPELTEYLLSFYLGVEAARAVAVEGRQA